MAKTRQQTHSEVEHLRGLVREKDKQIRRLRRENRALKKRAHFNEEVIDDVADEIAPKGELCPKCGKGSITVVDLVHLLIESCDSCEYRKKMKPKEKK